MGGQLGFLYRQLTFRPKPRSQSTSLANKTALITGSNSGLGLEAALQHTSHSLPHLILAVRDPSKASPEFEVEVWPLDQEDYISIVAFGKRVIGLERCGYVLLNAGVTMLEFSASSKTGHERNVQINHTSTALLPLLLILTLTSEGHSWIPFHERPTPDILAHMDEPSTFGPLMQRYYTTKLLNVLWIRGLSSRGRKRGGGRCFVDTVVNHESSHRDYLSEQAVVKPSGFVLSLEGEEVQKRFWRETAELLRRVEEVDLPSFVD
ncbi:short-chain dehydrogenase/reductase SDR [Amylocarpus encephaloides]|uniref:Short-chain dehydrogenase/reductase SDR n=1 Tax=Amylocarpus encephaloides TaxID=45428 RepID=A0A9P7YHJ0_9HELO|nr:short-chain dehydrogenase/reductase SDR [Amylocarpus encephaloides]